MPDELLEDIDALFVGCPEDIQAELQKRLPLTDQPGMKAKRIQLYAHLAVALAMQEKFKEAWLSLGKAQNLLGQADTESLIRFDLAQGRVYQQQSRVDQAITAFRKAFNLAQENDFGFFAADAAHMMAILFPDLDDKISWNKRAIAIAERDESAQAWLGSLTNNLGQNYLEKGDYHNALTILDKCLSRRIIEGVPLNVLTAKIALAKAERLLGRYFESETVLLDVEKECVRLNGIPDALQSLVQAMVAEELALLYQSKAREKAQQALDVFTKSSVYADYVEKIQMLQDILEVRSIKDRSETQRR